MKLSKLYIELSSLCNLRCKMCFRNNWFAETPSLMSDETVEAVKRAIADDGVSGVFFGGMGEPLLHPRLFELAAYASSHGKKTELITNATLLGKRAAQELVKGGLDTLWVSMDGFTEESYEAVRRGAMYRKITENLAYFNEIRENTELGITFVLMKENLSELRHINDFLDSCRADFLNLSHVLPASPMKSEDALYGLPYPIGKMRRLSDTVRPRERDICPFVRDKVAFIRADGALSPCMQLLHNSYTYFYEEKRKVYAHDFGNIRDASLEALYGSAPYRDFRARVEKFEFPCCTDCLGCEDRKENKTDCMYNTAPTCGACLWGQGYVRCP